MVKRKYYGPNSMIRVGPPMLFEIDNICGERNVYTSTYESYVLVCTIASSAYIFFLKVSYDVTYLKKNSYATRGRRAVRHYWSVMQSSQI